MKEKIKIYTRPMKAQKAGNNDSGSRRKKLMRVFGASALAIIMGIGTLCGVMIGPMNSSRASTSGSEENLLTPQEQLLAGNLGLDAEKDPVIFTTDYGLEIKSHDAGAPSISLKQSDGSITVSSTSWNYISAGGYNWIIIGSYSESSYTISTLTVPQYQTIGSLADSTPAGTAVKGNASKQVIKVNNVTVPAFSNAKEGYNGEIPFGCVLCLCAGNITKASFNASQSSGNNYSGSNLQSYMNNTVYGSSSELSLALQALPIVPRTLTTLYYDATTKTTATSTIENAYVFPLAGQNNTESFYVGSYLDSDAKRNIGAIWWSRSGYKSGSNVAYYFDASGRVSTDYYGVVYAGGVRPAFVLQLYSA